MTADLPPDVRDRAAQRAQSTWLTRPSDGWRAVVDAVAAVVAPEIARPLQARVEVLEAMLCAGLRDNLPGSVWDERARAVLAKGEKS